MLPVPTSCSVRATCFCLQNKLLMVQSAFRAHGPQTKISKKSLISCVRNAHPSTTKKLLLKSLISKAAVAAKAVSSAVATTPTTHLLEKLSKFVLIMANSPLRYSKLISVKATVMSLASAIGSKASTLSAQSMAPNPATS